MGDLPSKRLCPDYAVYVYIFACGRGSELFVKYHRRYINRVIIPASQCSFSVTRIAWRSVKSIDLTHWGWVTHICLGNLIIIDSDNGLSPGRRQAIIWTNAGILLTAPLGTNFIETLIRIQTFSFKKIHLKMTSAKWRPFCIHFVLIMVSCCILAVCRCCGYNPGVPIKFTGVQSSNE